MFLTKINILFFLFFYRLFYKGSIFHKVLCLYTIIPVYVLIKYVDTYISPPPIPSCLPLETLVHTDKGSYGIWEIVFQTWNILNFLKHFYTFTRGFVLLSSKCCSMVAYCFHSKITVIFVILYGKVKEK
jgi:hypothetical protein